MSKPISYDFALHDPALAIAPVFLVRRKERLTEQVVTAKFNGDVLKWEGPAAGIPHQSLLLGVLSIAKQQTYWLDPQNLGETGKSLLEQLKVRGQADDAPLAVAKMNITELALAAGYQSQGGNNTRIIISGLTLLSGITVHSARGQQEQKSGLLAWVKDESGTVTIALNHRATDALCDGQYCKISLKERYVLPDESAKALHAWLSSHMPNGCTRRFNVSKLQTHIWAGEAAGSTLRSRLEKVRDALSAIGHLPQWRCTLLNNGQVEIVRVDRKTVMKNGHGQSPRARIIADTRKSSKTNEKSTVGNSVST